MREYPNEIALQLLKMHKDAADEADYETAPGELEELRERLSGKVERLRKRLIAEDEGANEAALDMARADGAAGARRQRSSAYASSTR